MKVGGAEARDALVALLRRPGIPPQLAARILHAPVRFWTDGTFASSASDDLVDGFVEDALQQIQRWDRDFCKALQQHVLYKYTAKRIQDAIDQRAQ